MGLLIETSGMLILTGMSSILYSASSFALKLFVLSPRKKRITLDNAIYQSYSACISDLRARGQPTHTNTLTHTNTKLVVLH